MNHLKLLIPLDATPFSRQIIAQVEHLFPPATTSIILLHVRTMAEYFEGYSEPLRYSYEHSQLATDHHSFDKEGLDPLERKLRAQLERDAALFGERGYGAVAMIRKGEPVEEIVAVAQQEQVDAIAMATHGHTGIGQFLFGSVAQAVLGRVTLPIILLRRQENIASTR